MPSNDNIFYSFGLKIKEMELTQCLIFLSVKCSPSNTCPKCPPQLLQVISILYPSASKVRLTAPFISSSKLGHPH